MDINLKPSSKKPLQVVTSPEELDRRIRSAATSPNAWSSPYNKVADRPIPPYMSVRQDKTLIVEPESGYWEVVSVAQAEIRMRTLRDRVVKQGVRAPDIATYDSDLYPLECVLYLTNKCNLSCTYCYSKHEREADWRNFDSELLKKAIRMLFREKRRQSLCFLLFGGESLIAFDLMKTIVAYVHSVNRFFGKQISFRMQTNGSLLTEEKIRFLAKYQIGVGVSLDGPPEVHDRHRISSVGRGSHAEVLQGIELLKHHGVPFSIIATVSNPDDMLPVFDYFLQNNISSRIKISPLLPEGAAKNYESGSFMEYSRQWGLQNLLGAKRLIEHNRNNQRKVREGNLYAMVTHLVSPTRPDLCLRTPCGAAYGMIEFHPNGSLVTCDKTLYSSELGVVANLAEIPESTSLLTLLDESPLIAKIRSRTVDTIPKCSHCEVKRHCGGSCTLGSYDFFKDFQREDVMCEYRRYMFEELMWLLADDPLNALCLTLPERVA